MQNKNVFLLLFFQIHLIYSFAQIQFEQGYFINNEGEKINCLIKNNDWKHNPTFFKYKLNKKSTVKTNTIETVQEFGIPEKILFKRATVNIDRTIETEIQLTNEKDPIWSTEQLFLKTLVAGDASLFIYEEAALVRFFYSKKDSDKIEQLIYKEYLLNPQTSTKNEEFKQQILDNLDCQTINPNDLNVLLYELKDLVPIFIKHNECTNLPMAVYSKSGKSRFKLTLRSGVRFSNIAIASSSFSFGPSRDVDFGNITSFRFGALAEIILPYNRNKWSIMVEPGFQSISATKDITSQLVDLDYKSIEVPVGLRYYMFLNEDLKLFANVAYLFDMNLDGIVDYRDSPTDLEIDSFGNFVIGLGGTFKDRFSFEGRFGSNRELIKSPISLTTDFTFLSFILGYSIF